MQQEAHDTYLCREFKTSFMLKPLLTAFCFTAALSAHAQYGGPRLFLDIPNFYLHAPDVENIGDVVGLGLDAAMNVGTHWSVARLGGGATFDVAPQAEDLGESFDIDPYLLLEAGAGIYRSNGDKCAATKRNAFTAMAKGGLRYTFNDPVVLASEELDDLDYTVGVEFGYFYIADVFRNTEFVLSGDYFTKAKTFSVNFGFKFFLNLRANR